ncbi:MAG: hypothetical protein D6736_18885, partial [Nitrospinota bacterium]
LATSMVRWINMAFLLFLLQKKVGPLGLRGMQSMVGKIIVGGISMGVVIWVLSDRSLLLEYNGSSLARSLQVITANMLGGAVYFLACRLLGVEEAALVISRFRRRGIGRSQQQNKRD